MVLAPLVALVLPGGASASVLYVGDSLGVGTSPYLRGELGGTALEVDAEIGRPRATGLAVRGSRIGPPPDGVVVDLGPHHHPAAPEALAGDLAQARDLAGDRCLVIATLNRPPLNGVPVDGLNRAVTSFAARDPNVALVDWHAAAEQNPDLLLDGIHTDGDGYAQRASMFADAIASCGLGGGGAAPPGELEHESDAGLPPASAGRNTGPGTGADRPVADRRDRQDADVLVVATEVARAIATGADFG